ncbi:MAG: AMMECR1 domain-containing protein [Campylobacterota bacterium]|nr:AMMECR1 domain-containing protein [Campylobacterota bacterium]
MRIYKEETPFSLNEKEKIQIKELATLALYEAIVHNKRVQIDINKLSTKLHEKLGAFVTLYLDKKLKGCIGRFEPDQALYDVVIDMAIAASRHDTRFTPLTSDELKNTEV